MNEDSITFERTYDVPVEKVWQALTDENLMRQWYFPDINFKPEVGYKTTFNVHQEGTDFLHVWTVTEVRPPEKIAYKWRYEGFPGNSLLTLELFAQGDNRTTLKLRHEKLQSFMPAENPALSSENFKEGWTHFIKKGLPEFLERKL